MAFLDLMGHNKVMGRTFKEHLNAPQLAFSLEPQHFLVQKGASVAGDSEKHFKNTFLLTLF